MNVICPCFKSSSSSKHHSHETELTSTKNTNGHDNNNESNSLAALYKISRKMSAPSIEIYGLNIKGYGLALVDVSIEQDCAYWEWHVNVRQSDKKGSNDDDDDENDDFFNQGITMKFGVATRKDRDFYRSLETNEDEDVPLDDGTKLMKPIQNIQNGDTIGIAIQQDDLPMIQFLHNGEPLHDIAINRFRGMVYPSVYLEDDDDDENVDGRKDDVSVDFVWKEDEFKEMSPSVRFKPLMAAIGII